MKNYNDIELLDLLEANGYKANYKNLQILKEGLLDGSIVLDEEEEVENKETETNKEEEKVEEKAEPSKEEKLAEAFASVKKHNTYTKSDLYRSRTSELLESFLIKECGLEEAEFSNLSEDTKTESVRQIAAELLNRISEKLVEIDTTSADRSRGDIKALRELPSIQDAITQLEAMLERSDGFYPDLKKYTGNIIKSILYLNQYSAAFKEAYRNKKVLLMSKYQSLILSIISSVTYLISVGIDFTDNDVRLKDQVTVEEIAPLKTLAAFNNSVESGEFKRIASDMTMLREYFTEVDVETMGKLLEASDVLPMVISGIQSIYSGVTNNNKVTNLVYKITGVLLLILSLRDSFYSLFRMRTKVNDMIAQIQNFANINLGTPLNKLAQFSSKFAVDAEAATDFAQREIEDENKKLARDVKQISVAPILSAPTETKTAEPAQATDTTFSFDF